MKRISVYLTSLVATGLLVQGCAPLAPGFSSARGDAAQAVAPSGFQPPNVDPPPAGALTSITPELIRNWHAARSTALSPAVQALLGEPEIYKIGPGDVVGITVFDHPEIAYSAIPATTVADPSSVSPAPGYIVSNTGQLSFPYAGTLRAAGMTVQELEDTLLQRLARVYKNPQISVRVQAFRSKRVYVDGEVTFKGLQVFTDVPMTLPEALSRSGGILPAGDRSNVTLTRNGTTTVIDMLAMAEAGVDPSRIPLKSGDMITVRNRDERKVMVMGEVALPSALLMRNGRLSLNEALGEVGGVNLGSANPRQIYVIRNESNGQAIFHLDAKTPTALALADGFALKPRDVVYVDPVPLVQWNRVVSLILPTTAQATALRDLKR